MNWLSDLGALFYLLWGMVFDICCTGQCNLMNVPFLSFDNKGFILPGPINTTRACGLSSCANLFTLKKKSMCKQICS